MRASRLRTRYIAALAAVALLSITGQILVQAMLTTQENDSTVINLAGRQRMLSQRIVKMALIAGRPSVQLGSSESWRHDLGQVLAEWRAAHEGLRTGDGARGLAGHNSPAVQAAYAALEGSYRGLAAAATRLLKAADGDAGERDAAIAEVLVHEGPFLQGMDGIVSLYERDSAGRVHVLQRVELGLLGLVLLTLLLEGLLVFRPAERRIGETLHRLRAGEAEKSAILRAIPDTLVRVRRDGTIADVYAPTDARSLAQGAGQPQGDADARAGQSVGALVGEKQVPQCLARLAETVETGVETEFEYQSQSAGALVVTEARLVPCKPEQALLILRDISARRRLERELLQVAERERTRIGQDLHDDLCQQLAGLSMMARTMSNRIVQGKVTEAVALAPELTTLADLLQAGLKSARQMAHGLFPEVLLERGLAIALREVCAQASALRPIEYTCEVDLAGRDVEQTIAVQLYRMVQEAVGNAVRHARAEHVTVTLRSEGDKLCLEVIDDGIGLDGAGRSAGDFGSGDADVPEAANAGKVGGIGLRSMAMRARAIGAEFALHDHHPHGTRVVCRCPVTP